MSRFHDPAGALRPATLSIAGAAIASIAVAAIALSAGRPADPSTAAAASLPPAASTAPAGADPTPIATPVATPVATPTPVPAATPETDPGTDAMPLTVELTTVDGHRVTVDVVDQTGSVVAATSGRPAEGASAEGLSVENVDARTLRLTWVDFPIANRDALFIEAVNGKLRFLLVQPGPTAPTDAIGFDRVLILTFDRPVDAGSVEASIQEGLDTAG